MSTYRIPTHSPKEKRTIKYCKGNYYNCNKRLMPHEQIICKDCRRKQQLRMRGY